MLSAKQRHSDSHIKGEFIRTLIPNLTRSLRRFFLATVSHCSSNQVDSAWRSIPYGRPIWNHQYYCLSDASDVMTVHLGMTGQLYIGGVGVAEGYVGRPDLTAERHLDAKEGETYIQSWTFFRRRVPSLGLGRNQPGDPEVGRCWVVSEGSGRDQDVRSTDGGLLVNHRTWGLCHWSSQSTTLGGIQRNRSMLEALGALKVALEKLSYDPSPGLTRSERLRYIYAM